MKNEKLAKTWDTLVETAKNRTTITYSDLGAIIGSKAVDVGEEVLYPIQNYCTEHNLLPLTILVVSRATGLPSKGILCVVREAEIPQKTTEVQNFDWSTVENPYKYGR